MRKDDSNVSSDTSEDLQAELLRLQRQFRLLEDDRRAYKEETEYLLQKQRETIKVLNEEHNELAKDNKLAGGTKVQNFDAENTQKLKYLLAEESDVNLEFSERKRDLESVNDKIKDMLDTSDVQRKYMGGCKESERKTKEMNKMIMVMENRLNEANKKFNIALAENNKMRQEIDHIDIQRKKFEDLHKKLTKMFKEKKKEKDFLIETSTSLFNSRDEAHNRMQSLREKSGRDVAQYNAELKDLLRVIDHDKTLHEFMATKTLERSELFEASIQGRKEKKLRDYVKTLQGQVNNYDDIFQRLVEVSGMEDVDEMVKKFVLVEDENFAAFNYIKEQTEKIQVKEAAIESFKEQIKKMNVDETIIDAERKQIYDKLLQEEVDINAEHQKCTNKIKEKQEKIDRIAQAVDDLVDKIGCNRGPRTTLLNGSKLTNSNIIQWIGLVEQRCCELIQAKTLSCTKYKVEGSQDTPVESAGFNLNTIGKMIQFLVHPPSVHSDSMVPELATPTLEPSRPLSEKETRMMVTAMSKMEKDKKQESKKIAKIIE